MSSVLADKVRLVKCPKCRQLLTEYPHFDLYTCGGCGTTLQAKKRRSEDVKSRPSSHETDAAQRNASDLSHSIPEATGSPSGECLVHENSGRDVKENGECNEEQLGHLTLSDGEQNNEMDINKFSDLRIKEHVDSEKGCSTEASSDSVLKGKNSKAEADDSNSSSMGSEDLNNENLLLAEAEEELSCASDGKDANNEKSDDTISSSDGMDEGSPNQHLKPFDEPYTATNVVSEGRTRRGKILVNSMTCRDLETQEDSLNFTSDFPNRRNHVMENTERKKTKVLETTRDDRPVLNQVRTERDYYPSRMPFHHSDPLYYECGSPSNQLLNKSDCSSSFLSNDAFENPDQEKVKLLRMIYKLQDQLNRTISVNGETNGRRSTGVSYKGNRMSAYHSHDFDEGRFCHSVDYRRCNGRCNHGINRPQRHNFSSMPFLAEANADHSCFHFRHCSAELPPHVPCQHEELCRGQNFHFPRRSCPSSPQWLIGSRLPLYSRATKSGDKRHRAPEVKKYFREKQHLAKRHFRPVAGGAPFITCHKCFGLLQLPADFLLFKRACHQLKCGSCSEVLKFSIQNRSHIVSYAPNALGPPPSGVNDQSEEIDRSTFPSASHANHYPVSYSDDYGSSVRQSYPSEDPVLHGNVKIASRHSSTSKAPVATYESAGLSSDLSGSQKLASEMEQAPSARALHGLMGYSSPSHVIREVQSYFAGTSSQAMENMDGMN